MNNRTESNGFWMRALKQYYQYGENIATPDYLENILEELTIKDIKKSARKFLKNADVLEVIFVPEESDETTAGITQ